MALGGVILACQAATGLAECYEANESDGDRPRREEEKGFAPTTGIFSTRYMLKYLSEHGHVGLARRIVLHKGFPGWLHMLDRGAMTLWETWKELDDIYSNCHPMFGSVDEWLLSFGSDE